MNDYNIQNKEMNNALVERRALVQRRARELLVFLQQQQLTDEPAQRPTLLPEDRNLLNILERMIPAEAPAEAPSAAPDMDDYDTEESEKEDTDEIGTEDTSAAAQAATTTAAPTTAAMTTDGDLHGVAPDTPVDGGGGEDLAASSVVHGQPQGVVRARLRQ